MILDSFSALTQRFIVSGITIALVIGAIYFSYTPNLALLSLFLTLFVTGMAVREYYQIAAHKGLAPRKKIGIALSLLYILSIFLSINSPYIDHLPLICIGFSIAVIFSSYFIRGVDPFENIAVTLFGIAYLAIPMACILQINYFFTPPEPQDGRLWLAYVLVLTYITDSFALFIGKSMGRTKLAPIISPKKTWEGALGGFIFAVLSSLAFAFFANQNLIPMKLSYTESIILGATLSILAQIGDLAESLLKRDSGVKDSSKIPGLGGILDMLDSLIFTAPVVYLYLKIQYPQ